MDLTNFTTATLDFAPIAPYLTSLSAPALTTVGGNFQLSNVSSAIISFRVLTTVTGSFTGPGTYPSTVDFSSLATIGTQAYLLWGTSLGLLSLPALTSIGSTLIIVTFTETGVSIDLPVLATIGGYINGSSTYLTTLNLPSIITITGGIDFYGFYPQFPALTTFSFGAGLLTLGGNCNMAGCALDLASVDGILASLAALNGTSGTTSYDNNTIDLSLGTSATPDAAGLASIAILTGRGNTVNHN
jgi:hypothetical protein